MKKLSLIICLFFSIYCFVTAQSNQYHTSNSYCGWEAWFDSYCGKTYSPGKTLKVVVHAKNHHKIKYMELFINGDYVGKETQHPYDWGKPGKDRHLKNMRSGTYKMEVKIVDHCGKAKYIKYCDFQVKHTNTHPPTGGHSCNYHDLHWLQNIKRDHPDNAICEYTYNGHTYYQVYKCGVSHYTEYWYDCSGHKICQFQNGRPCSKVKYAKKVKCWYTPHHCQTGGTSTHTPSHCDIDAWFDRPVQKHHRWYVNLKVNNHHKVKHVELYVNGKHAGKESSHPYDWGKQGKDKYLTNLRHGNKYKLYAKIYTTCGDVVEKHDEFRVGE